MIFNNNKNFNKHNNCAKYLRLIFFLMLNINLNSQNFEKTYKLLIDELNENFSLTQSDSKYPYSSSIIEIINANGFIWIGGGKSVSKTTDKGQSWINYYGKQGLGFNGISALSNFENKIYAAKARSVKQGNNYLPEGLGLAFTSDGGISWQSFSQSVDLPDDDTVVYGNNKLRALPITTTINNITYDLAVASYGIFTANFAGGLRKSTDNGQTWTRVVLPPDYLDSISPNNSYNFTLSPVSGRFGLENNLNHRVFSVCVVYDSIIFVGSANGVNRSTDRGISWKKFNHKNQTKPISGNFVTAIAFNYFDNSLWIASWKAEGASEFTAVSFSYDFGESWETILPNKKAYGFAFIEDVTFIAAEDGFYAYGNLFGSNKTLAYIDGFSIKDNFSNLRLNAKSFYSLANDEEYLWIGSSNGLLRYKPDNFRKPFAGEWKIYQGGVELKSKSEAYAYPNPFSPLQEVLKIRFATGKNGTPVNTTIRIFDYGMNLVRTIVQNAPRGNYGFSGPQGEEIIEYWDGKDEKGNYAPNGTYFFRIDIENSEPIFGKIILLK